MRQRRASFPVAAIGATLACAVLGTALAQYGPDPNGVPGDFKCAWRNLTAEYANILRPDAAVLVHDALQLSQYCPGHQRPDVSHAQPPFPAMGVAPSNGATGAADGVWVDCENGSDSAAGTKEHPLRSIHAGVAKARATKGGGAVIVRAGTCYLSAPIALDGADSGLTISNAPGEEVWISGGVPLGSLQWERPTASLKLPQRVWVTDLSSLGLSDIASLRVDGARREPARYPNANPETQFWPVGYLTSKESFVPKGDWLKPSIAPSPNPATVVNISSPNRAFDSQFSFYRGGIGGTCSVYDPPFSFWCQSPPFSTGCGACFTWNIPSGLNAHKSLTSRPGFPYSNSNRTQVMAWRKAHWANWAFEVESIGPGSDATITFGKGGFQGARGGPGSDWFIQNVLEELDTDLEFYFDPSSSQLYVWANGTDPTAPPSSALQFVVIPSSHHTLLNASATQSSPLKNLTISGIGFRDTAWTMLQPHGVPSGGDWALERMAAVFLEGTEHLSITNCSFSRLGGNAIMLSKYHRYASITSSDFEWLGGSAVALWGWTDEISDGGVHGIDGTDGNYPRYTTVEGNLFREIGVYEKQSSAFFTAKAAQSVVRHNVVFNLARAGFNFNDGFGGGDLVEENVLFNTCRESSDHGPINAWDRQPYLTTVRTGEASTLMAWRNVRANLLIANYGGSKEVDTDDGSLFYNITSNFMAYGWGQKFKCGAIQSSGNVKAFISQGATQGSYGAGCLLDGVGPQIAPNAWHDDTMTVLASSGAFGYRVCWGSSNGVDWDKVGVHNNTIYVASPKVEVQITQQHPMGCPGRKTSYTLQEFTKMGEEPGSRVVSPLPPTDSLIELAREALGPFDGTKFTAEEARHGVW